MVLDFGVGVYGVRLSRCWVVHDSMGCWGCWRVEGVECWVLKCWSVEGVGCWGVRVLVLGCCWSVRVLEYWVLGVLGVESVLRCWDVGVLNVLAVLAVLVILSVLVFWC